MKIQIILILSLMIVYNLYERFYMHREPKYTWTKIDDNCAITNTGITVCKRKK